MVPQLTTNGVIFSYLDTAAGESEFDIFVGNLGSTDSQKTFSVGINYASTGCGRVAQHISFADKVNMNSVGQMLEYGVRAIQTYTNLDSNPPIQYTNQVTSMSKRQYRVPYLAYVSGTVVTQSGVGVEGVTVTYCHIDRNTGQNDTNPGFCPIASFTTNLLGEWSGQILVSDVNWIDTVENFYITAFYNQTMSNNRYVVHTFQSNPQKVAIVHLSNQLNSITDTTTISLFGSIQFDPLNMGAGSYYCAFANVPVVMVQGNGQIINTTSDSTGNFTFSITQSDSVSVYIPYYNGNTWRSTMSVAGVTTPDLSSPATIYSYTDTLSTIAAVYDFTYDAITSDGNCWIRVLAKTNNIVTTNAGQTVLNGLFQQFGTGNIKYIVNGATYNYYKRLTNKATFDFYTNFAATWGSSNNILNTDFQMYSTYTDLLAGSNSWQFCNYDLPNIGYPGDCGQYGTIANMWTGYTSNTPSSSTAPSTEIWIQLLAGTTTRRLQASASPTKVPTSKPSFVPSRLPSNLPTKGPSNAPVLPTKVPTFLPSNLPTKFPSQAPVLPTFIPTTAPSVKPTKKPTVIPTIIPTAIPTTLPTITPSKTPSVTPTTITPSIKPTLNPTYIPSLKPTKRSSVPSKFPITYPPSASKGCTSLIDFSGSATSGVVSKKSNCRSFPLPITTTKLAVCAYQIGSPLTPSYLWQVGYFNTLYPGGLGLNSCPYHDVCSGYMIQINASNIISFGNPRFSMITTPTTTTGDSHTYTIYGSNHHGVRGTEMLYSSNSSFNDLLPLPGVQIYKYLSFVAVASSKLQASGIILQKLQVSVPCPPSAAPSVLPTAVPTVIPSTIAPSRPTLTPVIAPTCLPTIIPTAPTFLPTITPSAPTFLPTTMQLSDYKASAVASFSSRPVLMHQFQFTGSQAKSVSSSCQQYIVDTIENTTASVCNYVEISNGQAIFAPNSYDPVPFIQINSIIELSDVNAFSLAIWVTLGSPLNVGLGKYPLFSIGSISFPSPTTYSDTTNVSPYEPLACYSTQAALVQMTPGSSSSISSLSSCVAYANSNQYNYFAYGPNFCSVANNINSTLFNSPTPSNSANCPAQLYALNDTAILNQYQGQYVNIAVAYTSYPSLYKKVYINGVFFKSVPMSLSSFTNLASASAYLGITSSTNTNQLNSGLNAQFEAVEIYFGELLQSDAQNLFLIGTDPSHVTISSSSTQSDIYLSFYSTSTVEIDIQMYGGSTGPGVNVNTSSNSVSLSTSFLYKMFGSETSFQLVPVDQQCTYMPIFNLDPESSSTNINLVPAMNYTVVYVPNVLPAPVFSNTSCPSGNTPCYCGVSESPTAYLTNANLLNQSFEVIDVNTTLNVFQYFYRTGLCYELIGGEQFSPIQGSEDQNGDSCFPSNVFYMDKTDGSPLQNKNITVKLFEIYPEGVTWFTVNAQNQITTNIWSDPPLVNWYIADSTINIYDQISNGNGNIVINNNVNLTTSCSVCYTLTAVGNNYQLTASYAFPSFPYDLSFRIYAKRSGSDGTFTVDNTWYIPVLGVVANEVPNFYPVSSDPNLIFMIIRDPPGGNSQVTITAGTSISFGLSVDNLQAYTTTIQADSATSVGLGSIIYAGVGIMDRIADVDFRTGSTSTHILSIASSYGSTSGHDYTFYFESDFSTSADPDIAGHPSDIIIGGGVDINVGEATQVATKVANKQQCFFSFPTLTWYPGKVSTFILPVIEIERIVTKLVSLRDQTIALSSFPTSAPATTSPTALPNDYQQINQTITNWNSILTTYRSQTNSLQSTTALTFEANLYNKIVNGFVNYQNTQIKVTGTATTVANIIDAIIVIISIVSDIADTGFDAFTVLEIAAVAVEKIIFSGILSTFSNYCGDVFNTNQKLFGTYTNNICKDFNSNNWNSFTDFFQDACSMSIDFDGEAQASDFYGQVCKQEGNPSGNTIPGGIEISNDGGQTLFQFLKSTKKYLTFGANAPTTLTWNTAIDNSLTHQTSFSPTKEDDIGGNGQFFTGAAFAEAGSMHDVTIGSVYSLNVDQYSSKTEASQRQVSIFLDDEDVGKYHY